MEENQNRPNSPQPDIDQLISQTSSQAYVFEHEQTKKSPLQWFKNLTKTRKLLLVAGGVVIVSSVVVIGLVAGNSSNDSGTSISTYASNSVHPTTGDMNGDGIIDASDSGTSNNDNTSADADETGDAATSQAWWQKILNISKSDSSASESSTASSVADASNATSNDGSDTSFLENLDTDPMEIDSSEVVPAADTVDTAGTGAFSIVALPDTQREVQNDVRNGTKLFRDSMNWIVASRAKYSIAAVVHSGDIVHASSSTGTAASTKMVNGFYETASNGFSILDSAGVLYSIASGNHDTDAICSSNSGGSIWCNDEKSAKTAKLLGKTTRFDKTYTTSRKGLQGLTTYEPGHVQSSYRTFSSGKSKWLILTAEYLVPPDVFKWAQQTVASHADYNVVLVVHRYMSSNASIMSSCEGSCTPAKTIFNNLVMKYPNVKIVVSGHAGYQAIRVDTSSTGNKVVEFQTTMHETTKNPLRLISIDSANGTVTSRLCLYTSGSSDKGCTSKKVTNMQFIVSK